ncbi:nuclease-related domain-containing protein [Metabacillus fastidiosus]|uniref:Nuclease-related domain-containing protein n=1 Tax=Metabacillus fastidiosus TaxID=1458 RepID=A0ABU6NZE9_9BACI|nr:nuclease-related domain-containing protein [Metabacillus fastidiosus]MED4401246.1 nuclease-related domain-containing protein [Metabacillus fastidiosus]MED4453176.1 nuclease-related domain-containing protein [Metabacillus fastidiosus]MED4464173.1 nuclease-related domain-containing protein [Metabacillus fastidiosus]
MAQLIKLYDYISRYEVDPYRYPGQFIRLKKQQWEKVLNAWEGKTLHSVMKETAEPERNFEMSRKQTIINKLKNKFSKNKDNIESITIPLLIEERAMSEEDLSVEFTTEPKNLEELKSLFLDDIFRFQIRWASSTLLEKSIVEKSVYHDPIIRYFLQSIPDHFLLLYKPVLILQKAPVELDIILISPTEIYCITLLERLSDVTYIGSKENFWIEKGIDFENKILNPLLSLNRTGTVVQKLMKSAGVELPIKKVIISRNSYIDYPVPPYDVILLDKRTYNNWFQQIRGSSSPLKHVQLKATQSILTYGLSSSFKRQEWVKDVE